LKTLITSILFFEQRRRWPVWSWLATWCPRALCWWPLVTPGVANEKAGLTRTRGRKRPWQARGTNALDFLRKV